MKFYLKDLQLPVYKCKKPKMTWHKGASWVYVIIHIDGQPLVVWNETTWGQCMYFELSEQWYRLRMFSDQPNYGIDLYDNKKTKITTKKQST